MCKDPIIEEIRQARFDIETECDNDFNKIFADAARIQKDLMIRKLHIGLNIPADVLIKPYEFHRPQQSTAKMLEAS